jgi:hypothetical protein
MSTVDEAVKVMKQAGDEIDRLRSLNAELLLALIQCEDELEQLAELGMSKGLEMASHAIRNAKGGA